MFGRRDRFLGATVGRKHKAKASSSSGLDSGITAGLDVLGDAAPAPVALVGGLIIGAGLLGFFAWKAIRRPRGRIG